MFDFNKFISRIFVLKNGDVNGNFVTYSDYIYLPEAKTNALSKTGTITDSETIFKTYNQSICYNGSLVQFNHFKCSMKIGDVTKFTDTFDGSLNINTKNFLQ